MQNRFVIFFVILMTSVAILLYDLTLHFRNKPSAVGHIRLVLTALRRPETFQKKPEPPHVDFCFHKFTRVLLKGHNISGNVFFVEPNPPIPIGAVNFPCRQFLIPKSPQNASRIKELIRCYSKKFVTYKTIGRVRRGLRIVKKIFDDNKIPLILCDGSLIGSHRYHGIIPYDDDFDFWIPLKKRPFIKEQLRKLCKNDSTFGCSMMGDTGHLQLLIGIQNKTKRDYASFIDFFSYPEGDPRALFPTKRPFEGVLYDAIRNYRSHYESSFGKGDLDLCDSYDHAGKPRVKGCKPTTCSDLNSFLPFVVVSETSAGRLEIGVNNSHIRSLFFHRRSHGVLLTPG